MLSVLVDGIGHLSMLARIKGKHAIKQNAHLQPFTRLLCDYAGKYDLKYLNKFELNDSPLSLTGKCLYCAFYLNELIHHIVPCNEPLESVYELYHQHLTQLQTSTDYEPILRSFEYQLLNELGFGIEFDIDADGELITPQHSYEYVAEVGFIKTQSHYSVFAGKVLLALSEGNYADDMV